MKLGKTGITPESFTTLGELLHFLRARARLSQRDLAAQVGYHYSQINRFEKNLRTPDHATLLASFAPALKIDKEPTWLARLLELAANKALPTAPVKPEKSISEAQTYRLPVSFKSMIGRERETTQLAKLLLQQHVRLLTLIGPPGVGKTRTALHVAEKISHHFSDGALFVNLMPAEEPKMVLYLLADALGLLETSTIPSLRSLHFFLQNKNLLIVMDNFEQVLSAAPQLTELLSAAPGITILVTSREALRVQAEREFLLSPLPIPNESQFNQPAILDEFPAVGLFVQRAVAVQPEFQLTEKNASLVAEICFRLDGLPLAIELAAARIQSMSLAEMLIQFDRLFDWLTRGQRDTPVWRQTLLGAIEWSYGLLTEPERLLLARLAVFSGGWTLESAEAICKDDNLLKKNKILNILSQLVDRSLVVADFSEDTTRYRFLDTIFHFAQGKLKEISQWEALHHRHLDYFSNWAKKLAGILEKEAPVHLRAEVDIESNNIRNALEWGLQNQEAAENALALISQIGLIWLKHSHFKEALEWVLRYMPISEKHPSHARLLFLATALSYWRDNLTDAFAFGLRGVEASKTLGNTEEQANILYYLGEIHRENGDLEIALHSVEESVAIYRESKNFSRLSFALTSLGTILYRLEQRSDAQHIINEALEFANREKNPWSQSYALRVQADNLRFDGKFSEAYNAFERALALSSEIDDRISTGIELANMSLLANVLNDHSASLYYGKKALALFRMIGNEYQQPFPQRMQAYAYIKENDLPQARAHCIDSLKGNQFIGHKTGVLAGLICLAAILLAEGNDTEAKRLLYTIQSEIAAKSISLMEPDEKAFDELKKILKMGKPIPKNEHPGLPQILNSLGIR